MILKHEYRIIQNNCQQVFSLVLKISKMFSLRKIYIFIHLITFKYLHSNYFLRKSKLCDIVLMTSFCLFQIRIFLLLINIVNIDCKNNVKICMVMH